MASTRRGAKAQPARNWAQSSKAPFQPLLSEAAPPAKLSQCSAARHRNRCVDSVNKPRPESRGHTGPTAPPGSAQGGPTEQPDGTSGDGGASEDACAGGGDHEAAARQLNGIGEGADTGAGDPWGGHEATTGTPALAQATPTLEAAFTSCACRSAGRSARRRTRADRRHRSFSCSPAGWPACPPRTWRTAP